MSDILKPIRNTELRIGNYINRNKYINHLTVTGILNKEVKTNQGTLHYRMIEPIKLTKEWIEKFGFYFLGGSDVEKANFYVKHWGINGTSILRYHPYYKKYVFELGAHSIKPIDYVHQLQNLFFAVTENELTTNTDSNEN